MAIVSTLVVLRLIVVDAPGGAGVVFGLQDKSGRVGVGSPGPSGLVTFDAEVRVAPSAKTGYPNFLGPRTHGPPGNRHLYLSHGVIGGDGWIKRIKVPLASISWSMIDNARGGALVATVDGRSSATVATTWRVE